MAGKQTTLTYGQPQKIAEGNQLFTATKVEFTSALGEYPKGGVALVPTSLGLTVGLISAAWATPLAETKIATEKEGGWKAWPTEVCLYGKTAESPENIVLYQKAVLVLFQSPAEKLAMLELVEGEAVAKSLGEYSCTVFAFGK